MSAHPHSLLSALIDGVLEVEEIALLEEHLALCADCRGELADLKRIQAALAAAPRRVLPAAFKAELAQKILRPGWRERWTALWFRGPRWIPLGAAAAAALAVGLAWWGLGGGRAEEETLRLEPFLAAHARTASDGPVPTSNFYGSDFSAQLASYNEAND